MSAAVPRQLIPADEAPPWVGASPVAALFAAQRPWREAAALRRDPVWHGEGVPDGCRLPVMLVPGFLAGDRSLSVYSRSDWVVHWRACVDPDADNVEIDSSHAGMSIHPRIYALLGERLAALAERTTSALGATG